MSHRTHLVAYDRPDGQILVRGLVAHCVIGAHPKERRIRQRVELDLVLDVTTATATAATDDLEAAVDYRALKERVLRHVTASRFHLLEALCHSVVRLCLATPGVVHADVTVGKPGALTGARSVAVRLARTRSGPLRRKRGRPFQATRRQAVRRPRRARTTAMEGRGRSTARQAAPRQPR